MRSPDIIIHITLPWQYILLEVTSGLYGMKGFEKGFSIASKWMEAGLAHMEPAGALPWP